MGRGRKVVWKIDAELSMFRERAFQPAANADRRLHLGDRPQQSQACRWRQADKPEVRTCIDFDARTTGKIRTKAGLAADRVNHEIGCDQVGIADHGSLYAVRFDLRATPLVQPSDLA